jgi:hypothetical protein
MEHFNKIKKCYEENTQPDHECIASLQTFLENIEIRKVLNAECVLKYSQTEQGKLKRREAQARYYKRSKTLTNQIVVDNNIV